MDSNVKMATNSIISVSEQSSPILVSKYIMEGFQLLSQEAKDLYIKSAVTEIDINSVTPLSFYRDYVSANQPVILKNACKQWPAVKKWSRVFFDDVLGDKEVTVAVTPNGYADAIALFEDEDGVKHEYFVMPEERTVKMSQFFEALFDSDRYPGVFYIQRQNSNLIEDFPELICDIDADIPWATEAFGQKPDAVNLWIGDKRAVTSMHKDPYENIYCVVQGYKDFILLPPTDRPWVPYKKFPIATYCETSSKTFSIIPKKRNLNQSRGEDNNSRISRENRYELDSEENVADVDESDYVPWICVDPLKPNLDKYPLYKNASPLVIRVHAGDALYLPSLWFHHVQQSHACIAVNYWYDMQYDVKYAYYQFLESLAKEIVDIK